MVFVSKWIVHPIRGMVAQVWTSVIWTKILQSCSKLHRNWCSAGKLLIPAFCGFELLIETPLPHIYDIRLVLAALKFVILGNPPSSHFIRYQLPRTRLKNQKFRGSAHAPNPRSAISNDVPVDLTPLLIHHLKHRR